MRVMLLGVRHKLIILSTLAILVVSLGFAWINLFLANRAIEEDLRTRAIIYAREVAATIGHRSELERREALQQLITRLLEIRKSALQLDVLAFGQEETIVVATNVPGARLPFSQRDGDEVRRGGIVSRAVSTGAEHHWEVMAPITTALVPG